MTKYLISVRAIVALFAKTTLAQETPPPQGPSFLLMMIPILLIVYFLMIVPEKKKQKARQQMLQNVKKGDKIVTIGGIMGTVGNVKDDSLSVKTAENTVIEVTKASVSSVINDKGQDESKS